MKYPKPKHIYDARIAMDMSHAEAAKIIYCSYRAWMQWETGRRRMHPALWELWQLKAKRNQPRKQGKTNG